MNIYIYIYDEEDAGDKSTTSDFGCQVEIGERSTASDFVCGVESHMTLSPTQ